MYDFKNFDTELQEVVNWLQKELASIRTGRATVTLLDSIFVEAYGSKMPLNQVASISQEDPKTLNVHPFDASTQIPHYYWMSSLGSVPSEHTDDIL
jgi:ribosome recycling factor